MKRERRLKGLILILSLCLIMLGALSGIVYAKELTGGEGSREKAAAADTKEETVYVLTDAKGAEHQRIVNADGKLSYDGYEKAELPVTMTIDYTLDGKKIEPKTLAGKSGKVEMRVRYENHRKSGGVYVPFLAVSGMVLDEQHFSDIEIDHGKVLSDGSKSVVAGYGLPGVGASLGLSALDLPQGFTLTADVKDFQLQTVYTVVSSEIFSEIGFSEDMNAAEITGKIDELSAGLSTLQDGTGELSGGAEKLDGGAKQLSAGAGALQTGAEELSGGLSDLLSGAKQLCDGAKTLSAGAETLSDGAGQLSEAIGTLSGGLSQLSAQSGALNQGAEQIVAASFSTANSTLAAAGLSVSVNETNYKQVLQQAATAVPQAQEQLQALENQLDQVLAFYQGVIAYTGGVDTASAGAAEISAKTGELAQGARELSDGAAELLNGQESAYAGIEALAGGAGTLTDGTKKLKENQDILTEGVTTLHLGIDRLKDGVDEMTQQIKAQIEALPAEELETLAQRLPQMEAAAENYRCFAGTEKSESVKFIFKADGITIKDTEK